ncbi:Peroxisome biogenesis protein 22 [Vitis vinifera]|uniref:Peroxisome biogenesis protein 22 n=1 Tax=Vitis vinifera TaxID=29760 RepID=A0A438K3H3_VITVI|nr:Peroxisome biogenesis protein 22 [Vitis vinifera]
MGAPKTRPTSASLCPCPEVQVASLMRPLAVIAPVPLKSCIQTENLEGAEVAVLCITKSEEVLNHQTFTDAKGIYRLAGTMPESDRWDAMPSQVLFKSTVTRLGGYDKDQAEHEGMMQLGLCRVGIHRVFLVAHGRIYLITRAQNVIDEFFQPVEPTLGQIVRQKLSEGRKVTCRLLGVILEGSSPKELQAKQATVRSSVPEVLLEITKFCDLYLMERVLDDESERKVFLALEDAGVFTSGDLVQGKYWLLMFVYNGIPALSESNQKRTSKIAERSAGESTSACQGVWDFDDSCPAMEGIPAYVIGIARGISAATFVYPILQSYISTPKFSSLGF